MAEQVASTMAGKVVDLLFGVIKKEIGYMWHCSQNVETFKRALRDLKDMRDRFQQQIDIAKSAGDNLVSGVENWVVEADEEISKAQVFLEQEANAKKTCFKIGMCGNWATLHHYGKKTVTQMTPSLLQLQASGTPYESGVSVYTLTPGPLDVYENKDLDDIVTQSSALNDIIAALEDDNIQIIGIYGLGGVGKTTLAKEVVSKVKNTLFADVAFTTVTQTVKVEEIKKDIGEATKRIMKGDKILIILDDVWEKLDLEELCIPINHKNCKILLTSRSEKVCQKMHAQSKICVNSLPTNEAWILFKRVVGEIVETDGNLKPIALDVTAECGGLPLLIQAVGNALKDEDISSWKAALSRLKKPAPSEMDPDIEKAFTRLQLSYEYLKSEEAKSCFLLCSMFPEDYKISLKELVYYMVGLRKFDDLESMGDARDRVRTAVNMLTSSCLLLNMEDDEGFTKMHDVVRDVALLIASQGNTKFLVKAGKGLTEWLPRPNTLESHTAISLMYNKIRKLPDYEVHLSNLEIFLVNNNYALSMISGEFIEGMKEIKVLDLGSCKNSSLPQSLKLLTKLCMLNLQGNKSFHDISVLGEMKELEILILNKTRIKEIPQEVGGLVNLRRLEVSECRDMTHVTRGVLSKLQRLEELCIDFRWTSEGVNDCIAEVMKLSKLTYLDLKVNNIEEIPECFSLEKLNGYEIQIGGEDQPCPDLTITSNSERYLIIVNYYLVIPLLNWIKKLIEISRPHIFLNGIKTLTNIMPTLYDEGFNKLEYIELCSCRNVSCLVDDSTRCDWNDEGKTSEKFLMELKHLYLDYLPNLMVIWKCPDEYISLANLVRLDIRHCSKLVRVFTVSVAQGLANLKYLDIQFCDGLEEVIYGGGGGESEEIVFPSLAKISLYRLKRLKSFFNSASGGNCSIIIKYPSLVDVEIEDCRSMKKWGPGIHETPILKTLAVNDDAVVLDTPSDINEAVEKYWRIWNQHDDDFDDDEDDDDEDDDDDFDNNIILNYVFFLKRYD